MIPGKPHKEQCSNLEYLFLYKRLTLWARCMYLFHIAKESTFAVTTAVHVCICMHYKGMQKMTRWLYNEMLQFEDP